MRAWLGVHRHRLGVSALALATALAIYGFADPALRLIYRGLGLEWDGLAGDLLATVAWGLAAVVLGTVALERARQALRTRAKIIQAQAGLRCAALVTTFSPLQTPAGASGPDRLDLAKQCVRGLDPADEQACQAALRELCESGAGKPFDRWPWQQSLRMIAHHGSQLRAIYLILSKEAAAQRADFEEVVRPFLPSGCRLEPQGGVVGLNEYNEVEIALQKALGTAKAERHAERDICIDITGGTKIWSAVATLVSVNTEAVFGYVQTTAPFEVLQYDVESEG